MSQRNLRVVEPDYYREEAPNSPEMENALLFCLSTNDFVDLKPVFESVQFGDFFSEARGNIYRAAQSLFEENAPIELVTLRDRLKAQKKWGTSEGKVNADIILTSLNPKNGNPNFLKHYTKEVKALSTRRQVLGAIGALAAAACDLERPVENIISSYRTFGKVLFTETKEGIVGDTADKLEFKKFEESRWSVNGVIAEGHTLLVAAPKIGKTYLAVNLAIAVAAGGIALNKVQVEQGRVCYLSLDDTSERRMQAKLRQMLPMGGFPALLHFFYKWPSGSEGIEALDQWLDEHSDTRLVIVDTLHRLKEQRKGYQGIYEGDVDALSPLTELANRRKISLITIHHNNKGKKDDVLEEISGSQGVAGSVDNILFLKRERASISGTLEAMGRDFDEYKRYSMMIVKQFGLWELQGDVPNGQDAPIVNDERKTILELLQLNPAGLTPNEIAEKLKKRPDAVRQLLSKMVLAQQIERLERGVYAPIASKDLWEGD